MAKAKKKRAAMALPPLAPGELDKFKTRARNGISEAKADYDNAVALYVQELKKEKYAERAKKGDAKHWWKANVEDLCPWVTALKDYKVLKTFTVPKASDNFAAFGAVELYLAITYANDKGIAPIPKDPRSLTIDFLDDDGHPVSKPFPECSYSELLLAVHGVERRKRTPRLDADARAWLDIAHKTLDPYIDHPERHFVGKLRGDNTFWSLLNIADGQIKRALNDLAQAINDFYARGTGG